MYLCHLSIVMVGFTDAEERVLRSVPLPKECSLDLRAAGTLADAAALPLPRHPLILLKDGGDWTPAGITAAFGAGSRLALLTEHPERLAAEVLDRLHALWTLPMGEAVLRFHFRRLLECLQGQKELWYLSHCLDTVVDTMPGFVWFKDNEGRHLKVNQAFCDMVGKPRAEIIGKKHYEVWGISPEQYADGEFVCLETDDAIAAMQQTTLFKEQVLHARLGMRQLETYKSPIFDEDGKMIGNIGVAEDVTAEYANRDRMLHLSRTDELTHLANRRYFYQYVDEHRVDALTLCYIDLDHFKQLNDTFGHQFGDAALMALGELLQKAFPLDFITRLGGDEFVIAIFTCPTKEVLAQRLDRLCRDAAEFFQLDVSFRDLAMSIGVASAQDADVSLETLLQWSDDALYYSKEHCRGSYSFYEDIKDRLAPRGGRR